MPVTQPFVSVPPEVQEAYKTVDNFFDGLNELDPLKPGYSYAQFIILGQNRTNITPAAGCHAGFQDDQPKGRMWAIGSACRSLPEDNEGLEAFWQWLSGKESPYVKLFEYGINEHFKKNGTRIGWSMRSGINGEVNMRFIKHFAIITRMYWECPRALRAWYDFVKAGVHPSEAFLLCCCFSQNDRGSLDNQNRGSTHWPLTFPYISMLKWMSGDISLVKNAAEKYSIRHNGWFHEERDSKITATLTTALKAGGENQATKFGGTVKQYTVDGVIKTFNNWKDQYGY